MEESGINKHSSLYKLFKLQPSVANVINLLTAVSYEFS